MVSSSSSIGVDDTIRIAGSAKLFQDHILSAKWTADEGWHAPRIEPYKPLSLDPAAAVFHYAFCCFEGMKAYKDSQSKVRFFRPEKNIRRMNDSAVRIALPAFNEDDVLKLLVEFTRTESRWIPEYVPQSIPCCVSVAQHRLLNETLFRGRGFALYLRPTLIGIEPDLSVSRPQEALLYIIASPVGNYFGSSGMKAISLEACSSPVRAWPGGVGHKKVGGNYAPTIVAQESAGSRGHQQVLWLLGDPQKPEQQYATEVGTMNLFVAWVDAETQTKELITCPLDGTILPGITRDSILDLARERLVPRGWRVTEARVYMNELKKAAQEGRLLEVFGAGTALVVNPIRSISWNGEMIDCGLKKDQEVGEITMIMKTWIEDIQYGETEHPWR